ncbi:metallophosphoesterase [Klebsiella pneumoniae]|nr:metallophosphoesterase [Klebsiella pneumoniae]MCZ9606851.1 metallophosphoesterase [Klebsiella pneumoniae]MCZ9615465.1 metallophosphoesterase [Klebsiella pneumoniae]MCZ9622759.1 metallophosphoesterase [Klebsiella pneumoniae]MCZ9627834.1 metallophosphoesterase [Klebsiella pneumoniae]
MFHLWTLIPAIYIGIRVIFLLRVSASSRCLLFFVMAMVADFHLLSRLFFGTMFSPELPEFLMIMIGWGFGFIVIFFMLLVIRDLMQLIRFFLTRKKYPLFIPVYLLPVLASSLAGIGVYQSVKVPDIREVEVRIQGLPEEFDGYRITQLTDIHVSRLLTGDWLRQVVEKTNALDSSLILITGDIIDGTVEDRRPDVSSLAMLKAPDGVFAVTGNHEYYFDGAQWTAELSKLGLHFLNNEHTVITRKDVKLVLAGITDEAAAKFGGTPPDLSAALSGIDNSGKIILMSHRPNNAPQSAAAGVSLQLSGHTHGGMVYGFDKFIASANNGFVSGLYDIGQMSLYISNGTGIWNGFPLRLGKLSEITVLTLRSFN